MSTGDLSSAGLKWQSFSFIISCFELSDSLRVSVIELLPLIVIGLSALVSKVNISFPLDFF